ncbi:30S ribosomal protein S13 [archaeon]|nr:30S ribosomal protein S13 [archaeon]|tara:strand:- start:1441 stop:1938 length:498 start_codon:yes stop_codon:yes gene_type:complete
MAEEFKRIVRVLNTDIDGNKNTFMALKKIKGIGFMFSNAICNHLNLNKNSKVGSLSDEQIKSIHDLLENTKELPSWLLNRRSDPETGEDSQLTTAKLRLTYEFDLKRLKQTKSYRGLRHAWGLPLRGQRTRSNFRKGKSLGVVKKATKQAQAASTAKKPGKGDKK